MNNEDAWEDLVERQLLDEVLTDAEQERLGAAARAEPVLAAELDLLGRIADLGEMRDETREHELAEQALAALRGARTSGAVERPSNVVRLRWAFTGALAAAAAAALLVMAKPPSPETVLAPVARAPSGPSATFVRAEGAIVVDGVPENHPKSAPEGASVELVDGSACLELGPSIHACLAEGSRVRLSELDSPKRRLDLLEGRVVIALEPQPPDARFSVVAAGVWSTAVGTMFAVEVNEDGVVQTSVYEGKVLVGDGTDGDGSLVVAHKIGLSTGGVVEIDELTEADPSEEWKTLEGVSGRKAPPPQEPAVADGDEAADEPAPEPPASPPAAAVAPAAVAAPEPPASAADLLADARQLRAGGKWQEAAGAYREIEKRYPSSPEARAVLVSLAELELRQLGQPAAALEHFDAYLTAGGPLAIEAKLGRVRALRSLGDVAAEATAIDAFLAAHPHNLESEALRARKAALGAR